MSKGPGRLYISGEYAVADEGMNQFTVRVPDGYVISDAYVMPIEDQPVGDTEVLGYIQTFSSPPAVTDGTYFNALFVRFKNINTDYRGVYYQIFLEPHEGSDVHIGAGSI